MHRFTALAQFILLTAQVFGQQVGTLTPEIHPSLNWQKCTSGGVCTTQTGSVVIDANWRWLHATNGYTNCFVGNTFDAAECPDPLTCAENCALDGADYSGTYGITTSGSALTLKFTTAGPNGGPAGARVFLLANETEYEIFHPKNQEFTFDVDVSNLPCGLDGAVYFTGMDADGGLSKYPTNKAGAKYGTGYCDAKCPRNLKFINGRANVIGWSPSPTDPNTGTGQYGSCCTEMDVWEANVNAAVYTPHPCSVTSQTQCSGVDCGSGDDRYNGVCDPDGCDFNSYRNGNTTFYGNGLTVNSVSKFTVVTQFITADNTTTGALTEIRRIYIQNGKIIQNSATHIAGMSTYNSISDKFCTAQKAAFDDLDLFETKGGLSTIGTAFDKGMVLVMSALGDSVTNMQWLDGIYPVNADPNAPGVKRGTCGSGTGHPEGPGVVGPTSTVTYSNIKFGDLGSTFLSSK